METSSKRYFFRNHQSDISSEILPYLMIIIFLVACAIVYLLYKYQVKKRKQSKTFEENPLIEFQNLAFYRNEIPSRPNGDYIENILTKWRGNNFILETNHSYMQWLFPNRMQGVNSEASILRDEEAEVIRCSPELKEKVKRSFEMMLEFYGMKLTSNNKFELAENGKERLAEVNKWHNHNFFRISRILLALKELGHQKFMLPWMIFLTDLIYKENLLSCAASSFENYWLEALDANDKIKVNQYKNMIKFSK